MAKKKTLLPDDRWQVMKTGFEGIEQPYEVLNDLVRELGVTEQKSNADSEKTTDTGLITATGWRGTKTAGYRWTEWRDEDTNAYIGCRVELYGFHDVMMVWAFTLSKSGYEYRYQHGSLHLRFTTDDDQRRFALWWHGKRGRRPELEPSAAPRSPAE